MTINVEYTQRYDTLGTQNGIDYGVYPSEDK